MSSDLIDGFEAFGRIRAFICKKYGNQRKCAHALGLSESHLSDMLNARCEMSPVLLAAAGLVRRTVYQVVPEKENPLASLPDDTPMAVARANDFGVDMPCLVRENGRELSVAAEHSVRSSKQ